MADTTTISSLPDPRLLPLAEGAMSVTLGAFADAFEALLSIAEQPLSSSGAARVVALTRWAHPQYCTYVEARGVAAEAHGEKCGEGKYNIPVGKWGAYASDLAPTRALKAEVDPAMRLTIGDLEGARVSPTVLAAMAPFLAGLFV